MTSLLLCDTKSHHLGFSDDQVPGYLRWWSSVGVSAHVTINSDNNLKRFGHPTSDNMIIEQTNICVQSDSVVTHDMDIFTEF